MKIKIKKIHADAKLPSYAHPGDVGLDLFSLEDKILEPGVRHVFPVGFALEFPAGYAAIIKDKGSLSTEGGLHSLGGVYDAGYRGEYNVCLVNLGQKAYNILKGQKIAQLVIIPVIIAELEEAAELSESARGHGKWGSTGKF
ncbi:MAG: dUTP diphosphatase [Candidatus Magasanikbacteria bacterium]|nr:dUTP diphosphatase [Candidatus Magasanikbacteria bacterium]